MTAHMECTRNLGTVWFLLQYSKAIIKRMVEAQQRNRTLRTLRQLDVHLLRDIGVDPIEIGKPSQEARQFLARIYLNLPGKEKARGKTFSNHRYLAGLDLAPGCPCKARSASRKASMKIYLDPTET